MCTIMSYNEFKPFAEYLLTIEFDGDYLRTLRNEWR